MLVTRTIETGIMISQPMYIYSDAEKNMFNLLVHTFQGKCFRGCYIHQVLKIRAISECIIEQHGPRCNGRVYVTFDVKAIVYTEGESIHGCKVKHKDKQGGIIIAESKFANICLAYHPSLDSVQVGQIISVRAAMAKYNMSSNKISVNAYPFTQKRLPAPIYQMPENARLTEADKSYLADIITEIEYEEKIREDLKKDDAKGYEFFEQLLRAYEPQKIEGNSLRILEDILRGKSVPSGWLSSDPRLSFGEVAQYDSQPNSSEYTPVTGLSLRQILLALGREYADSLKDVREILQIYNTDELKTKHKNIWRILAAAKKGAPGKAH